MKTLLYYLSLAALFTHELDAVLNWEWRLLFHLFELPETTAQALFIGLHFPLFLAIFHFGHHANVKTQQTFRLIVCAFAAIHGVLHFGLSHHEQYYFEGLLSNLYIFGSALFGTAFIISSFRLILEKT